MFAWLGLNAPLKRGIVAGFGTVPDCTGCDHNDFIDHGAEIHITVERLGTLRCRFPPALEAVKTAASVFGELKENIH